MTSFLCLPHAARLDLLEQLTRTALSEYYGLGGGAAQVEVQQHEHNAARRVTPPGRTSYVARLSVRVGNPAHQQRSEMRWLERSSTGRSGKGEFGAYEEFARAFPAGYTQVRPLPTNWARLLEPYLLLSRRLHPRLRHHSSPRQRRRRLVGTTPHRRHRGKHAGPCGRAPLPRPARPGLARTT
ncbi:MULTISPECIES: hypothetical protein [unclassified Streptomyces]|uniref:hypothetical protein n=1 Tax=unclassified Streptomyces TaxID=2593676 RepID=UPI0022543AD1|nr:MULTISPECIES: hypothetical protein [unclassified Streptomyces]MCX5103953.1 hypothetical protein [Streptomyces sp. NBC_00439]WSP44771.1 hypothetical protein OG348_02370 [Streptomyces sp. NBC_01243]WSX05907.1 hypothetical protein OG355_38630 [Streptomyces sp. NBC_00987]